MKKLYFSYLPLALLFFFPFTSIIFAQDITAGNASSYSKVETNIEGNGNVQTHIEVEANGKKKLLDGDKQGTYEANINSDTKINDNNPNSTKSSSFSSILDDEDKEEENNKEKDRRSLIQIVIENLSNFIKRIFNNL